VSGADNGKAEGEKQSYGGGERHGEGTRGRLAGIRLRCTGFMYVGGWRDTEAIAGQPYWAVDHGTTCINTCIQPSKGTTFGPSEVFLANRDSLSSHAITDTRLHSNEE